MTDRYQEGYEHAEQVYRQRFNFRYELLYDTKVIWEEKKMNKIKVGLRKLWPDLANQLDDIAEQADHMKGEYR